MTRLLISAALLTLAGPALSETHFGKQAVCFYGADGSYFGSDHSSPADGNPTTLTLQRQSSGGYAFYVARTDEGWECPKRLDIAGQPFPVWE